MIGAVRLADDEQHASITNLFAGYRKSNTDVTGIDAPEIDSRVHRVLIASRPHLVEGVQPFPGCRAILMASLVFSEELGFQIGHARANLFPSNHHLVIIALLELELMVSDKAS